MRHNALVVWSFLAALAPAQSVWTTAHTAPRPDNQVLLCAHRADQRIVALSGRPGVPHFETWEWDGASWAARHPPTVVPSCFGPALAYDAARRVIVLFGGIAGNVRLDHTWEWDGLTWMQRHPVLAPSPRYIAGMCYDTARARTVLFGGYDATGRRDDLWEWDGGAWTPRTPPGPRPPAVAPMMTYDEARGVVVVCPHDLVAPTLEVFEYDGTQWSHPVPAVRPPGLNGAKAAYDPHRGRAVLYGGNSGFLPTVPNTGFWEWDGAQWWRTVPPVPLGNRTGIGFAYDEGARRFVLNNGGPIADTWTYDAAASVWTEQPPGAPYNVRGAASDQAGHVFVTDLLATFLWDRATQQFERITSVLQPPVMTHLGMGFDLQRRQAVLLGATGTGTQTWLWSEATRQWQQHAGTSPPYAYDGSLAYDVARGETIFFGGVLDWLNTAQYVNDTWAWNGTAWSQPQPSSAPPERAGAAMAFDFSTGGLVLFGGNDDTFTMLDDVWDWNGVTWTQRTVLPGGPIARTHHTMVTKSNGVCVIGGDVGSPGLDDVWLLQGNQWTYLPSDGLPPLTMPVAASDFAADEVFVFGGQNPYAWPTSGVWMYGVPPPLVTSLGGGCGGSSATTLTTNGRPSLGNATFGVRASGLTPHQAGLFVLGLATQLVELPANCRVFVAPQVLLLTSIAATGTAGFTMPIPAATAFVGTEVHVQAAALDPVTGFALTPALTLRMGQ